MFLFEPSESLSFLALLQRHGLSRKDFVLTPLDTLNGSGPEDPGAYGWVAVSRISTGVQRTYLVDDESDWLAAFSKDVHAGTFDNLTPAHRSNSQ